jgi:hypothetical protein
MGEILASKSGNWLVRDGAICWMKMKAAPGFSGKWDKISVKAGSPPAEAPIPTIRNGNGAAAATPDAVAFRDEDEDFLGLRIFFTASPAFRRDPFSPSCSPRQ